MEDTIQAMRSDLLSLFKEHMKGCETGLLIQEENLEERAKVLCYKESELHDLFAFRRTLRHHLMVLEGSLQRMMRSLEKASQEQVRQDSDLARLRTENEKLKKEIEEMRQMHAQSKEDIRGLIELMNSSN